MIDESTDITVVKLLGVSIIYFSNIEKVVSTYLGLIELEACDAESIVNAIKTMLNYKELNISKLAAIGTDNASVMVLVSTVVYTQSLKQ